MDERENPQDPTVTEDLEEGYLPERSLGDLVDGLEERVLEEDDNPVLDVDHDADAEAVADDTEFSGDDVQPPLRSET